MDKIEGKIVLVVDDESEIRQQLQELLLKEGYEVLQASDGEEALSVLEKSLPDLIILDIIMPKIDGVKVLKKARETYQRLINLLFFTLSYSSQIRLPVFCMDQVHILQNLNVVFPN